MTVTPDQLRRKIEAIGRGDHFDVAVHGYSDAVEPSVYSDAGATWWLESIHDMRASFDELLLRIAAGPPSTART